MTITETVLVFVGIPAVVAGVLALLIFGSSARRGPRYRPGRPFAFTPVWFTAAPGAAQAEPELPAIPTGGRHRGQLSAADTGADSAADVTAPPATKKGGARGTW